MDLGCKQKASISQERNQTFSPSLPIYFAWPKHIYIYMWSIKSWLGILILINLGKSSLANKRFLSLDYPPK